MGFRYTKNTSLNPAVELQNQSKKNAWNAGQIKCILTSSKKPKTKWLLHKRQCSACWISEGAHLAQVIRIYKNHKSIHTHHKLHLKFQIASCKFYGSRPGSPVADFALTRTIPNGRGCRRRLRSTPFLSCGTRILGRKSRHAAERGSKTHLTRTKCVRKLSKMTPKFLQPQFWTQVLFTSNWHWDHIRHHQGLQHKRRWRWWLVHLVLQTAEFGQTCAPLQWHDQWHPWPLAPRSYCQPIGQNVCTPEVIVATSWQRSRSHGQISTWTTV